MKTPIERRVVAAVAVLGLAPVVGCGLWTAMTLLIGGAAPPAPAVLAASVVAALLGLLPSTGVGEHSDTSAVRAGRARLVGVALATAASIGSALLLGWVSVLPTLVVGVAASWVFGIFAHGLPRVLDGWARGHRRLAVLWLLTALLAVGQSYRASVFMLDHEETGHSIMPGLRFVEIHSCATAYFQASVLARDGHPNLYDFESAPQLDEVADVTPFWKDEFQYPPPFLLLSRLLLGVTTTFVHFRALWFVLTVLVAVICWVLVAAWVGGRAQRWMIGLAPLFWLSLPVQGVLQMGNFHLPLITLAIAAMVALDRGRMATGGGLLAFATLSKISPAILGVFLVARRQFRAAAWTAAFGLLIALAVLAVFGPAPWTAFFEYDLPRIQSGEAFGFLDRSLNEVAGNFSPFAIPFKLRELGLDMGWDEARSAGNLYSVALIVLGAVAGWRLRTTEDRAHRLCVWLALLTLASLRSPFATMHVFGGLMWLLVLLAGEARGRWISIAALWLLFSLFVPIQSVVPALVLSFVRQAILLGGLVWVTLRSPAIARVP